MYVNVDYMTLNTQLYIIEDIHTHTHTHTGGPAVAG